MPILALPSRRTSISVTVIPPWIRMDSPPLRHKTNMVFLPYAAVSGDQLVDRPDEVGDLERLPDDPIAH